jgi:hypothetical protein
MSLSALLRQSGDAAAALASSASGPDAARRRSMDDAPSLRHAPSLNDFSLGFGSELAAQDGAAARRDGRPAAPCEADSARVG